MSTKIKTKLKKGVGQQKIFLNCRRSNNFVFHCKRTRTTGQNEFYKKIIETIIFTCFLTLESFTSKMSTKVKTKLKKGVGQHKIFLNCHRSNYCVFHCIRTHTTGKINLIKKIIETIIFPCFLTLDSFTSKMSTKIKTKLKKGVGIQKLFLNCLRSNNCVFHCKRTHKTGQNKCNKKNN